MYKTRPISIFIKKGFICATIHCVTIFSKQQVSLVMAPNRSKSYLNDMNKNCLEELPDMTRRT